MNSTITISQNTQPTGCGGCGREMPWIEGFAGKLFTRRKCDDCIQLEKNREEEAKQACAVQDRVKQWKQICPPDFQKPLDLSLLPSQAAGILQQALSWEYGQKGLFLTGESGWGKTRTALTLARRVFVDHGKSVRVFECGEFQGQYKRENSKFEGAEDWLKSVIRADLVVLDELGSERPSASVESALLQLISQRAARGLPMIITTNCSLREFTTLLSDKNNISRISRRLSESCQQIVFA